ncbi:MAG: hypothetical protein OEZ47_17110 [Gammaproteobacteria bacterium]|nr:hypothetical protein [Gammaproteobacteria bacterium]
MREGIIAPDKWKDFPHHHGKEKERKKHIMKARGFFLKYDLSMACFHLGVALHYVQDSYVSLSTRSRHHTRWEEQMDEAHFTDNLHNLAEKAFYNRPDRRDGYLELADILSNKIEGKEATLEIAAMPGPGLSSWFYRAWGKPYVDVNFALKASWLIAKSVFSPRSCPKLQEELKHIHQEYERKLGETEQAYASSIVKSIKKRNELENRKRKNGFLQTIKNGFLTASSKRHGFDAKRKLRKYRQKKHLKSVLKRYEKTIEDVVAPHRYWYHYDVPKVDLDSVERELLSVKEASEHLRISEKDIRGLIAKNEISCYHVENEELVKKSELTRQI